VINSTKKSYNFFVAFLLWYDYNTKKYAKTSEGEK